MENLVHTIKRDSDGVIRFIDIDTNYIRGFGDRAEISFDQSTQKFTVYSSIYGVDPFVFSAINVLYIIVDGVTTDYTYSPVGPTYYDNPLSQQQRMNDMYKQLIDDLFAKCCASGGGGGGGGDMLKSVYDPASVSEQLVGLTASQSLTNKNVNGVTLSNGGAATDFLNEEGNYVPIAAGGGKFTYKRSARFLSSLATRYYMGDNNYGGEGGNWTSFLSSLTSCDADHIFEGGLLVPFALSNLSFKATVWTTGTTGPDFGAYLLKGTRSADNTDKTSSIALTTVASNVAHPLTNADYMYNLDATSVNGAADTDFLIMAFSGSETSKYYYVTFTIYGDLV